MIAVFMEREICTQLAGRDRFHEEIHFLSGKLGYTPSGFKRQQDAAIGHNRPFSHGDAGARQLTNLELCGLVSVRHNLACALFGRRLSFL